MSLTITTGSRWLATHPDTPDPSGMRTSPTCSSNGGVAPARVSERSVSSSTWTKQTSDAVAAVIILATAAAIGSTPGPLEVAAMMSSSSVTSRSASTSPCTACALTPPDVLTERSLPATPLRRHWCDH